MQLFDNITPELQEWLEQQKLFFVGTAPLSGDGHVNLSPKGHDCFRILDNQTVCYNMDMSGSGNETSAHIAENGRITLMWCGLEGPPRILRLYGQGEVILKGSGDKWNQLAGKFPEVLPGTRQIIVNHVDRVQTSCGYAVPYYEYKEDREVLKKFFKVKEKQAEGCEEYWRKKNMKSIDGLTTLPWQKS
mmetsp:Transcript_17146/g.28491  ORF Transcript_17146/g.28491 Transcript_17146/m.28491 type:complete len:189 (+) Transcript_17146:107-673(+)|eukprot:CAMPEP_0119008984 /NCGR_PEP_ID=MMETSP1176-20130426/4065_1 /TAXON_ID=265551 /ORGANISM="Synedropsis recta cf, Strain CCMP1620" /LENGTH=188 /DNA_ID=CAMNT_0006961407 /DNA_START=114 /DNA_END=680 /DNA_ORIENTATION=-